MIDDLAAELEAAHAQAERRQQSRRNFRDKPAEPQLADDIADALLNLHMQHPSGLCRTCCTASGEPELWPCPTIRTVRRLIRMHRR